MMRALRCLFPLVLGLGLLTSAPALAQSDAEEQARERLVEAKQELEAGNFETARSAADAALRLYPSLYEAMMYKALAYEGLGELKRAKGLLSTFKQVSFADEAKARADEALARIQEKLGEVRKAAVEQEASALAADGSEDGAEEGEEAGSAGLGSGGSASGLQVALPLDMPDFPAGSEEFLSWMLYRQQLAELKIRRDTGIALIAGGAGLAGLGSAIAAAMISRSSVNPGDPNIAAGHGAGLGAIASGATLVCIGLPIALMNGLKASRMSKSRTSTARLGPQLDLQAGTLALRF